MPLFQSRWGFTGLTGAKKALIGLLSYTTSILYISALSTENFRKFQKSFVIEIQSQQRKTPARFSHTPYRRGYRLSRKSSRLRRLGFDWGALSFLCLCISRAICIACIRFILMMSPMSYKCQTMRCTKHQAKINILQTSLPFFPPVGTLCLSSAFTFWAVVVRARSCYVLLVTY